MHQIADKYGTPCYVYSKQQIEKNWFAFVDTFNKFKQPFQIFYAIKANSNLSILNLLHKLGAGFDAVSGGEIARVIAATGSAENVVFSGVGKTTAEIEMAIKNNIKCINIESEPELERVQNIAALMGKVVHVAFRINPDVDAQSHPYISTGNKENKFGIDFKQTLRIYKQAAKLENIRVVGISCHIGSQITSLEPFLSAIEQILKIVDELKSNNINIEYIDIGGGLGVRYHNENPPTIEEYVTAVIAKLKPYNLTIHIEPGRSIIANAGTLLSRVEYLKITDTHNFAIIDAAMNDLMRPALYDSYHEIENLNTNTDVEEKIYSVVGPVCESGDFIGKNRALRLKQGDLLAIKNCGAYGYSMSSNYNTRPRPAEVLIDGKKSYLICSRETIQQLLQNEIITDEL